MQYIEKCKNVEFIHFSLKTNRRCKGVYCQDNFAYQRTKRGIMSFGI